jgi:hypothetical protein
MKSNDVFPFFIYVITLVILWYFIDIRREAKHTNVYLEKIEQQNHILLLHQEKQTGLHVEYADSTNTYHIRKTELFK